MPFSRFAKMPSEKRERLLTIAAQEFATHGFGGASFNRILEEAQIGKSSAYYYFEDKADLFCTVVGFCLDRLQLAPAREELSSLTAETFWPAIANTHDQPLLHAQQDPWLFGAVRAAERLTPESLQRESLAQLTRSLTQYMMIGMSTTITRGQELGLIRTDLPDELLMAWFRAIDGASDDWLLAHLDHPHRASDYRNDPTSVGTTNLDQAVKVLFPKERDHVYQTIPHAERAQLHCRCHHADCVFQY